MEKAQAFKMKKNMLRKSLKVRMIWPFSAFVAATVLLITIGVAVILTITLTRDLKHSLSVTALHSLKSIEQRISFLIRRAETCTYLDWFKISVQPRMFSASLSWILKDT